MIDVMKQWFYRYFSDPQAVLLFTLLLGSYIVLVTMSSILAPLLVSIVIAYLLEGLIFHLQHWGIRRSLAIFVIYSAFIALASFILVILIPLLFNQLTQFLQDLPSILKRGQEMLKELPKNYPDFISDELIEATIFNINAGVRNFGQSILSYSLASIPTIIALTIYSILVPLMVFFFLTDKRNILNWMMNFLPKERSIVTKLWQEMDTQIGNYIRGKVYELFIVGTFTYLPLTLMGLNYAPLLSVAVGLSVFIPYIGAVVVTIPVIFVAYFQWGWGPDFIWAMVIYTVVQVLDGNVLVPLLFSETVNLHPISIIIAILVFGGLWGFWGVFFAIPLAALVKALISNWPRVEVSTTN